MPVVPATVRWEWEDQKFKVIPNHVLSYRPVWASKTLSQKHKQTNKNN